MPQSAPVLFAGNAWQCFGIKKKRSSYIYNHIYIIIYNIYIIDRSIMVCRLMRNDSNIQ